MPEILQNKNSATRFQILVEIAAMGPNVQQKHIAARVGITPQAVSDYFRQLGNDGLLSSSDRSTYRVSPKGVNWMLRMLREMNDYAASASRAVTNITVCAAIAEDGLQAGQEVGLKMKDGLLYATARPEGGARGTAVSSVQRDEDVDVSNVRGLVDFSRGAILLARVPSIQKGGSRRTDIGKLKDAAQKKQVGAIGIEALVALRRAGIEANYRYGVIEAAVEAARCGLPFLVVATADSVPALARRLQSENLDYDTLDLATEDTSITQFPPA